MQKPDRKTLWGLLTLAVCLALVLLRGGDVTFKTDSLSIRSDTREWPFNIEIAESIAQRQRGLMYRDRLAAGSGMLFLSPKNENVMMWMQNTKIPLDMLFIDQRGYIVYIAENAVPYSTDLVGPNMPVKAVLEIPGGTVKSLELKEGDRILHHLFTTAMKMP